MIKKLGKSLLASILEHQVLKLKARNELTIVAVVGSVGKTTTKLAIARMLEPSMRVRYQTGNYNDRVTVPLVFFGQDQPGIFNILGWFKVIRNNAKQLKELYPYDVVVLELGSDAPGQIKDFAYLQPDYAVVTALTDEHMANFKTLDAVATEELTVLSFAKQAIVNVDDAQKEHVQDKSFLSYGASASDFVLKGRAPAGDGNQTLMLELQGTQHDVTTSMLGEQGAKAVLAAIAVGRLYGLSSEIISQNVANITAVPGRMQLLKGINGSTIIDDSYNASPAAVKAALDVLYDTPAPQKIAVLGNMNEMGDLSPGMHTDVGDYCDPTQLALVATIGTDANEYLAAAAEAKGCTVERFTCPFDAGDYLKTQVQKGAVILVKGSQNGVFSEEVVKKLLADKADVSKLVRQSDSWMALKKRGVRH